MSKLFTRMPRQTDEPNELKGVAITTPELLAYEFSARDIHIQSSEYVRSVLTGRHTARMRGRGLSFEEIRAYTPGDDIRTMDWKVTARTNEPHVRVYTEERDRAAIYIVDQRIKMFFGSQRAMKSVAAAEVCAYGAWRSLQLGDRVGGCVFNDDSIEVFHPRRSRNTLIQMFDTLERSTHTLAEPDYWPKPKANQLLKAIEAVTPFIKHDNVIFIVSDAFGFDEHVHKAIATLNHKNDVLFAWVHDPLELNLPKEGHAVLSGSEGQLDIDFGARAFRQSFADTVHAQNTAFSQKLKDFQIPFVPISTQGSLEKQLMEELDHALSGRANPRGKGWTSHG